MHGGLQMTNGTLTLVDALFQEAYICASVGNATRDYNSRPEAPISMLSLSLRGPLGPDGAPRTAMLYYDTAMLPYDYTTIRLFDYATIRLCDYTTIPLYHYTTILLYYCYTSILCYYSVPYHTISYYNVT